MYPVTIYDTNINKLAEIDGYIRFTWQRKWRKPDEWTMDINRYAHGADQIAMGRLIVFPRGTENRAGVIEYMKLNLGQDGKPSENWHLRGFAKSGIFYHRLAYSSIGMGTGYDVQTGPGETVMRHFVDAECISTTNPDRVVSKLVLAPDQGRGAPVVYRGRLQDLARILEEISIYVGLGYEVEIDMNAKEFVFTVYEGLDLTPSGGNSPVIFGPEFADVKNMEYLHSKLDTKTVALIGGQGEGASRLIVPVYKGISTRFEYEEDWSGTHTGTKKTLDGNLELENIGSENTNTFGTDTIGNPPANFTDRWAADHTFLVQLETGATDGKVLQHTVNSNARRMISWDAPGSLENVIIETKCKCNVVTFNRNRLYVRSSGSTGSETGYYVELYDGKEFNLRRYTGGLSGTLSSYKYSWSANTYYRMKLEAVRDRLRAKVWLDGGSEPENWQIDTTDDLINVAGWVGIGTYTTTAVLTYDWLKVTEISYAAGDYKSPAIGYSAARIVREHKITWTDDAPAGTTVTVEHSVDGGSSWNVCTNGDPLPNVNIDDDLNGVSGKLKISLNPGTTPYTPTVEPPKIIINGRNTAEGYSDDNYRELFIDARDLTTSSELIQRGNERLAEYGVEEIMQFENLPGGYQKYISGYEAASQTFRQHPATWISKSEENEGVTETPEGNLTLDAPGLPQFTRPSVAYLSDGTQVAPNLPRFEAGKFAQAVTVEEGTANILTANQSSFEDAIAVGSFASPTSPTIARDNTVSWVGAWSVKLTTTSTGGVGTWISPATPVTANQPYTFTCYTRGTPVAGRNVYVQLSWRRADGSVISSSSGASVPASTAWRRLSVSGIAPADAVNVFCYIYWWGTLAVGDIQWIDGCMLEQKSYLTSWHLGGATRAPESLTIPTAGVLSPTAGTIEQYTSLFRSPGTNEQFIFDGAGAANQNLQVLIATNGRPTLRYGTGADTAEIQGATAWVKDTQYAIAWKWEAAGVKLLVNGVVVASSATAPSLAFGANAYLGSKADGTLHLDGLIDDLRISSRARTDTEILAGYESGLPLAVDANTKYKLNFDEALTVGFAGYDIINPYQITDVENGLSSLVTWEEIKPAETNIKVYFGLSEDAGTQPPAWYEVTNGGSIAFITGSLAFKGKYLWPKVVLDATDLGTLPEMIRLQVDVEGRNAIWGYREGTFKYLTDYKCGDIVQADWPGIAQIDARIIEVLEEYTEQGESHRITLGREIPDIKNLIRKQGLNIDPEIRR